MTQTQSRQLEIEKIEEEIALNEEGYNDPDNDESTKQYYLEEIDYLTDCLQKLVEG